MSNILDKFKEAPAEEKVRDMSKKIKVGIIGTGWIAEAHVKAYQKCPDVEIVALAVVLTIDCVLAAQAAASSTCQAQKEAFLFPVI